MIRFLCLRCPSINILISKRGRRVRLFAVHTASLMSNIGSFDFVPTGDAGKIEGKGV